jgi:hypothetical protein
MGNLGAYINVKRRNAIDVDVERAELDYEYHTFQAVPHPAVKPMQYAGMYGGMMGI